VDDDGSGELVDELHELFITCQHSEIETAQAAKLTVEEKRERIEAAIEATQDEIGQPVDIDNLNELLETEVKAERSDSGIVTDKGSFIDDILRSASESVAKDDNQQTKGH
jgi:hypothetical protein